jgi:SAM-dependent methyltransferase
MYFPYGKKYGVDPLIDEFRKAGYRLPKGMVFRKGVGEKIPFRSGFFDVVMCMNAIDHARDPARIIEECARVLRAGGHLVLEIYVHNPATAFVFKTLEGTDFRQRPHPHFFTAGDVLELVGRRFEVVDTIVSECDQSLQIPEDEGAPVARKMTLGLRAIIKRALVREYLVVGRVRK